MASPVGRARSKAVEAQVMGYKYLILKDPEKCKTEFSRSWCQPLHFIHNRQGQPDQSLSGSESLPQTWEP